MHPPNRIICLTEETVEVLYRLGEQDRIVGISGPIAILRKAQSERLYFRQYAKNFRFKSGLGPDLF